MGEQQYDKWSPFLKHNLYKIKGLFKTRLIYVEQLLNITIRSCSFKLNIIENDGLIFILLINKIIIDLIKFYDARNLFIESSVWENNTIINCIYLKYL